MIHLLHGNFGLPGDWDAVSARLPAGVRFRTWNLWQTRRDWPEADSMNAWAQRFNREAAADLNPRVIAGYSLGGRLAMHVLIDQPTAWDAAVILAAHPGIPDSSAREERYRSDEEWARRCSGDSWSGVVDDWNRQPVFAGSPARRPAGELVQWRNEIAAGFRIWSTGLQDDLSGRLGSLSLPVIWCTGDRDARFTALAARCAARGSPIHHRIIPGAGHRLLQEAPEAVAEAVTEACALAGA